MHKRWVYAPIVILLFVNLASCEKVDEIDFNLAQTATFTSATTFTASPPYTPTHPPTSTTTEIPFAPPVKSTHPVEVCVAVGIPEIACTGVSQNNQWNPLIREFNNVEMALVPAGCFQMGNDENLPEEQPVHEVCFDQPFWIDRTEVTVTQFTVFLNGQPESIRNYDPWLNLWSVLGNIHVQLTQDGSTWYPLNGEGQRPIENVTWFGAINYCAWREARLPTEAEWEFAARGPSNYLFPWGDEFIRDNVVRFEGRNPEVGSKPQGASWVGALDMSGSLFEWTSSLYLPYPFDASDGREASMEIDSASNRVFRGSAWYHPEGMHDNVSATARFDAPPEYAAWYYGFRCARALE